MTEVATMPVRKIVLNLIVATIICIPVTICGCEAVTGSGEIITLQMDYEDFERIEAGYAFDIEVSRADTYQVNLAIDEVLVEYLNVKQSGGTVYIGLKSGHNYQNQSRKAEITLPTLSRMELSGASKGVVRGFSTIEDIDFELSGASRLEIKELKTGKTELDLSGASKVTGSMYTNEGNFSLSGASTLELSGTAPDISVEASGSSEVMLDSFNVVTAKVELSGASEAEMVISKRLDINLSGGSKLIYSGDPKLGSIDVSGSSSIVQK